MLNCSHLNNYKCHTICLQHIFFRFLQIRTYRRTHIPQYEFMPKHSVLDILYLAVYTRLNTIASTEKQRSDWEKDLGTAIPVEIWNLMLANIHHCSVNARHAFVQFKIVHRPHLSKSRLQDILYNQISPHCVAKASRGLVNLPIISGFAPD